MKKISLMLITAGMVWMAQTAQAQTQDTTKNKIEVTKKSRVGSHGRKITKIRVEGSGTAGAISEAADRAITGKPRPARIIVTPAPPAPPAQVIVVHDTTRVATPVPVEQRRPVTTETSTTTTETKPVAVETTSSTHVTHASTTHKRPTHVYHKTYKKKPAVATSTKTTTTTTKTTE